MYEKEWNVKKSVADSVEEIIYYRAQYFHEDLSIIHSRIMQYAKKGQCELAMKSRRILCDILRGENLKHCKYNSDQTSQKQLFKCPSATLLGWLVPVLAANFPSW
jgi:hypothetical protein